MRSLCLAVLLTACTTASPLAGLDPQIEIASDPTASSRLAVSLTTWVDLADLRDAIDAHEITVTLDGEPLALDPTATGTFDNGDRYVAAFALPAESLRPLVASGASAIAISDGALTWSTQIDDLFANDLAPSAPLVAGSNVFEWPSAASALPVSTIAWACFEVVGSSAGCSRDANPAVAISQQYITAAIPGASGSSVEVSAERDVNPASSDDGPTFFTRIRAQYDGVLH